jgi:hypothetical protein
MRSRPTIRSTAWRCARPRASNARSRRRSCPRGRTTITAAVARAQCGPTSQSRGPLRGERPLSRRRQWTERALQARGAEPNVGKFAGRACLNAVSPYKPSAAISSNAGAAFVGRERHENVRQQLLGLCGGLFGAGALAEVPSRRARAQRQSCEKADDGLQNQSGEIGERRAGRNPASRCRALQAQRGLS